MPFDLDSNDTVGIWTENPKSPDELYKIRPLTGETIEHFQKMTTIKYRDRTGAEVSKTDDERYRALLWDHVIEGWLIKNTKGEEQPCKLENKILLATKSLDRATWLIDTARLYGDDHQARLDAERNSFRALRANEAGLPGAGLSDLHRGGDRSDGEVSGLPAAAHTDG